MTAEARTSSDKGIHVTATPESAVLHVIEIEVEPKRVKRAVDRAYKDLAKRVQVPGFRPGKAPRSVLEKRFGGSLAEQLEQQLVAETLGDAIELSGVEPVTEPAIATEPIAAGESFRYTARVEVKPEVTVPDTKGLEAKRPVVEVADDDVEQELESLRQRSAPLLEQPEDTEAAEGHIATVDFVGRIDGTPFEGGSGRAVDVEIGGTGFIPGFSEGLIGARAGEDREVRVTFPEGYHNEALAGKDAAFAVHVATIKGRVVAELDDEFAKDMGDFETLDDLRSRMRDDLSAQRQRSSEAVFHRSLIDSLIERAPFEVPPGMIDRALERQLAAAHRRLEGQVPHDALHRQMAGWREEWREGAEREVRERLLLEAVARQESLDVSDDEVGARISEMANAEGMEPKQLEAAYGEEALREALRAQLADEKALAHLGAEAKVEETTDS